MKKLLLGSLGILLSACASDSPKISVTYQDEQATIRVTDDTPLKSLISNFKVNDPSKLVFTLSGDRKTTISWEEFKRGTLTDDLDLEFKGIVCECANVHDLESITMKKAMLLMKGDQSWVITSDPKIFINEYVTKNPKDYIYFQGDDTLKYDDLPNSGQINMAVPDNAFEVKMKGKHPSHLFSGTDIKEAILKDVKSPDDYIYIESGREYSWSLLPDKPTSITMARRLIHICQDNKDIAKEVPTGSDTQLANLITIKNPEAFSYVLESSSGFSPPPLSWNELKEGIWKGNTQESYFKDLSSKYSIRDLASIRIVSQTKSSKKALMIQSLLPSLETRIFDGEKGVLLSDFIIINHPERHRYKLVAADGYSPEPFDWTDMKEGYFLINKGYTVFPHKDFAKNRINDLEQIIIQ